MPPAEPPPLRVGYVMKQYPRYSETFIVNELLAHESAGLPLDVFSLRPASDGLFQDAIARVRTPVTFVPYYGLKVEDFWSALQEAQNGFPNVPAALVAARGEDGRDVFQALRLAREARKRGISLLHAHFASAATTVVRLAARMAGLPYTFTGHAKDIFHESVDPHDLRNKLADAAAVITVSDYNLRYLRETYGEAAARVTRLYNGLDLARFPFRAPDDRPPLVVGVGRLVEKKGFDVLIEACALLKKGGCSFRCQIVGSGEAEASLQNLIAARNVDDVVEMTGPRPQSEVVALVQGAAVFAAPCIVGKDGNRDGLPTVLLEAMALGTPCVSTDVTGIPEVLQQDQTGLMVPQHDPAALAGALDRLLLGRPSPNCTRRQQRPARCRSARPRTKAPACSLWPATSPCCAPRSPPTPSASPAASPTR